MLILSCLLALFNLAAFQTLGEPARDAPASQRQDQPPASATSSPTDNKSTSYLNVSFEAQTALDRAGKHVAAGEWPAAARAFQQIVELHGNRLRAVTPNHFVSLGRDVLDQVAAWPSAGLTAYRDLFERPAAAALGEALREPTAESLLEIADRYFPTRAAATALDRAADLAIERGDFLAARQWLNRLLLSHPDRAALGPQLKAKLAVCALWEGDARPARELLSKLRDDHDATQIPWGGRDESLTAFLESSLADAASSATAATPASASADAEVPSPPRELPEARAWCVTGLGESLDASSGEGFDSALARREAVVREYQSGRLISRIPVFGDGLAFVHDYRSVWAIDPEDPEHPAWRFDLTPEPKPISDWAAQNEAPPLYTATIHDGCLYVHLDENRAGGQDLAPGDASTLLCLDARSGRERWRRSLQGFGTKFEETRIDAAPVVVGRHAVTVVRRRKGFGFEAAFLVGFDAADGRIRWKTHLGEAATGTYGYRRPTLSRALVRGDWVLVCSNLGTIAAVSAATGQVAWLRTYAPRAGDAADGFWPSRLGQSVKSWHYQPPLAYGDQVLFVPMDLEELLICRLTDGEIIARVPLEQLASAETLLGIDGDHLYAAGTQLICFNLKELKPVWQRPFPEGRLFGCGTISENGVFVPTDRGLIAYPLDGGPPVVHRWPIERAGNVLALEDQWIVAAPDSVSSFMGRDGAYARLERAIQKAPDDPRPALRLADLAFELRDFERGMAAVDSAMERAGGLARLQDDALRRRFFTDLSRFAASLTSAAESGDSSPALADVVLLLEAAGRCAPDNPARIRHRFQLAHAHVLRREFERAIASYQGILNDRGLREIALEAPRQWQPVAERRSPDPSENESDAPRPAPAGLIAERWIDELIQAHGRGVYAAIERSAAERLRGAVESKDPAGMMSIVETFPNSMSGGEAVLALARLQRDGGDRMAAARSYMHAYRLEHRVDRPTVLRELCACLAESAQWRQLADWLDRAERVLPGARFTHGGREISFAEYRKLLLGDRRPRDPAIPELSGTLKESFASVFKDRATILDPVFATLPESDLHAALTWSAEVLNCHDPVNDRSCWPAAVRCPSQPTLLGMTARCFVLSTGTQIMALTRDRGEEAWTIGRAPRRDPNADPESETAFTEIILSGDRLLASNDRGELLCVDVNNGGTLWSRKDGPRSGSGLAVNGAFAAVAAWQDRRGVVTVLDARTGRETCRIDATEDRPIQALFLPQAEATSKSPPGSEAHAAGPLLVALSRAIHAFHPATGRPAWSIETNDNFVISSLQIDADGFFVSPDGATVARHDLATGRRLWATPMIGSDRRDGLWTAVAGGRLLAASANALMAFDSADGRLLWKVRRFVGLNAQAPRVVEDGVLAVTTVDRERPRREKEGDLAPADGRVYRVRKFRMSDGAVEPLTTDGDLITAPLESFGGIFVRDQSLLLLDGSRIIGYVATRE